MPAASPGAMGRPPAIVAAAQDEGTRPRLKACLADDCQWAFYDLSRNCSAVRCHEGLRQPPEGALVSRAAPSPARAGGPTARRAVRTAWRVGVHVDGRVRRCSAPYDRCPRPDHRRPARASPSRCRRSPRSASAAAARTASAAPAGPMRSTASAATTRSSRAGVTTAPWAATATTPSTAATGNDTITAGRRRHDPAARATTASEAGLGADLLAAATGNDTIFAAQGVKDTSTAALATTPSRAARRRTPWIAGSGNDTCLREPPERAQRESATARRS